MKKTLLYLEDNGYLLNQTLQFLEEDGYRVISCNRIDLAKKNLESPPDGATIDCIITDLNMDGKALGEYRGESYGDLLAGWVWLRRFVYEKKEYCLIPSIIYSGYITDLEDYLRAKEQYYLLNTYPVSRVSKGGNDDNGYVALSRRLKEILN